jgi:hypothetical protein
MGKDESVFSQFSEFNMNADHLGVLFLRILIKEVCGGPDLQL